VVYYVYTYATLVAEGKLVCGEPMNVVVPTGNFGNILAAYYAKQMGVPVKKLICASNENKVLFDFFQTGVYDRKREFVLTSSPSMDILVSSNLERLIYTCAGEDSDLNAKLMQQLKEEGKYEITSDMKAKLADFAGGYATEAETAATIRKVYEKTGYVIDTHTAVAATVFYKYKEEAQDDTVTVIASTASPYKFTRSVMEAVENKATDEDDFTLVDRLCEVSGVKVPNAIEEIRNAKVRHTMVCDKDKMQETVVGILGLK
jgi:threonine synthase